MQTELATLANKMGGKLNTVGLDFEKCEDLLKEQNLNEKKELEKLLGTVDGKIENLHNELATLADKLSRLKCSTQ